MLLQPLPDPLLDFGHDLIFTFAYKNTSYTFQAGIGTHTTSTTSSSVQSDSGISHGLVDIVHLRFY